MSSYDDFKTDIPVCDVAPTDLDPIPFPEYTDISIDEVTDGTVDGDGMFDVLMRSFNNHIQIEWGKSRLRGTEYSSVYLGGMQACLQAAMEFALTKDKVNLEILAMRKEVLKAGFEVELIKAQVCKTEAEREAVLANSLSTIIGTDLTKEQILTQVNQTSKVSEEVGLVTANKEKTIAEKALVEQNTLTEVQNTAKTTEEVDLVTANTAKTTKETLLVTANTSKVDQETLLVTANTTKTESETSLLDQKTLTETNETDKVLHESNLLEKKTLTEVELACKLRAEYDGIIASTTKTLAEKLLIDQKKETEAAQVNPAGVNDGSVIDAQIKLYQQQTKGFKRNAEQQAAKIMTDYSTAALVQGSAGFSPDTSGFKSDEIKAIIEKLATGLADNNS